MSYSTPQGSACASPRVTALMCEFNTPVDHLRASVRSLLDQSFSDFELIIVDDCGVNDVSRIVAEFEDDRIQVVRNRTNLGFALSLQEGLKHARAPLIARVDTDDLYAVTHLEKLVLAAELFPSFAVYSSCSVEFSDDGSSMVLGRPGEKRARDLMRGDVPIHPATLIRLAALVRVGGYPTVFRRAEDLALWFELILAGERILVTSDVTHRYRVDLADYKKRGIRHRGGELRARMKYYPQLGAGPVEYLKVARSVFSGIAPARLVRMVRRMAHRQRRLSSTQVGGELSDGRWSHGFRRP